MRQQKFDFDRAARLALLDDVPIDTAQGVSGATARSVLRAIETHARGGRGCWASAKTIGEEIGRHERTVRRAISYLAGMHWLHLDQRPGRSLRCRIDWGTISAAAAPLSMSAPSGHGARGSGHGVRDPGHGARGSVRSVEETPPPQIDSWTQVGEQLRAAGVVTWRTLIDQLPNQITAAHALELIAYREARPGAWQLGALVARLRAAAADTPVDELWQQPNDAWQQSCQRITAAVEADADNRDQRPPAELVATVIERRLGEAGLLIRTKAMA